VPLNGCGSIFALPYFYTFMLLVSMILLHLFVGVILDSMTTNQTTQLQFSQLTDEVVDDYDRLWDIIDPYKTNFLPKYMFPQFLKLLKEPLGLAEEHRKSSEKINDFIHMLNIETELHHGVDCMYYDQIIVALAKEMLKKLHSHLDIEGLEAPHSAYSRLKALKQKQAQLLKRLNSVSRRAANCFRK